MSDQIYIVNPFSSQPFEGSAVGVCILEKPREQEWMVGVTRTLNLADAAFLIAKSPNRFDLRCIAGSIELDLGIAATLAAAHVLFANRFVDAEHSIAFFTHGGPVSATMESGIIEVNFPTLSIEPIEPPEEILQAVDPDPLFTGRRGEDYMVQVSSESRLKKIYPDLRLLDALGVHGLTIFSEAPKGKAYDFAIRTFQLKPRLGAESAQAAWVYAALGPFWMTHFGKAKMKAFRHASKSTVIPLEVDGDRVKFFGEAVTLLQGELKI